jgi:hypothetical protein
MRRGAKSKLLEYPGGAFKALAIRLPEHAAVANCHKMCSRRTGRTGV